MTYEVYAIKYAERNTRNRAESFILADDHNSPHPMDYFIWLIRNEERTILVDTGYDGREAGLRDRAILIEPGAALAKIGVHPDEIDQCIITHLHYDHAGGLDQFPNATLHMQSTEMEYATGPCMCHGTLRYPYTADHICEAVKRVYAGKVQFYDGDDGVAPGISVHALAGHSKGLQGVMVETDAGPLLLASDASHYYENFELGKPFPLVVDVEAMLNSFDRMRSLAPSDRIIPGHDPLVRQYYPQVFTESGVEVHRLDVARLVRSEV